MAVSHVKALTIADGTNTDIIRPSDWGSAHNQYNTLGGNTVGTSTVSGTNIIWAGGNSITLSGNAATITISGPSSLTISSYIPVIPIAASNVTAWSTATSGSVLFWPFSVLHNLSFGIVELLASMSFSTNGTSSGRQTGGVVFGIYSRGTGTNSTTLGALGSTTSSFGWSVTGNNSTYSVNQPTSTDYTGWTTAQTTSAGSSMSSAYTGLKQILIPWGTYLTPGVYWFGLAGTQSTSSINVGISASWVGASLQNLTGIAPMGSYSSAFNSGTNFAGTLGGGFHEFMGVYSGSAAGNTGLETSIVLSNITGSNAIFPYVAFWST